MRLIDIPKILKQNLFEFVYMIQTNEIALVIWRINQNWKHQTNTICIYIFINS